MSALQSAIPSDQLAPLLLNLEEVRKSIFTSDAWRSFFIVLIGVVCLWSYCAGKLKAKPLIGLLALLCLIDMWNVNKRYLYDGQFVAKGTEMQPFLQPSETDKLILQDKSLDYRVLNLSTNTFNENNTSYWHKSIGGYHAAKLRRYQEVIDEHIQGEMASLYKAIQATNGNLALSGDSLTPVLNMLNTRYIIVPLQGGATAPVV